ncbi:DUF6603 domain-containing protein [Amycolatopsis sacchari]|uniref:DUF6603 domain-containing protein n=1 Tax=Amycolatopsis sacchari TaxID=115433 RepID=UPI003D71E269
MSDLAGKVLAAGLGFARGLLTELVPTDPAALLDLIAPGAAPAAPDLLVALKDDLERARAHASAFAAALQPPPDTLDAASAALGELSAALSALDDACRRVSGASAEPALTRLLDSVLRALPFGGLVSRLGLVPPGLTPADGLTVNGTTLSWRWANPAERALAPEVELANSVLSATLDFGDPRLTFAVSAEVTAGLAAGDALVAAFAGTADVTATLAITVDTRDGVTLGPGVRGRLALPGRPRLPGYELRDLGLLPSQAGFDLTGTLAGTLNGVIAVTVQETGVRLRLDDGHDIVVEPSLSAGAGVRIDAGRIKGGGSLERRGSEYAGTLDLTVGPVEVKAIGLIGTDPFSFVVLLFAEFVPAIQLGLGFTLNGVGGLLAVERAPDPDALRAGLADHTADRLLFPADPQADAAEIAGTLSSVFKPRAGAVAVGPALELGWGAPTSYATAKVAVILTLPAPAVLLLGAVRVTLPTPQTPVVDLNADVYGEIDEDHLLVLVRLGRSRFAGFTLSGDLGLLISWGAEPGFAISAGGFHPAYHAPAELAGMRRLSVDLSPPALLSLRAEAYLALTTNAVMFGCRAELRAEVAGVGAEGHLSFDALLMWDPFGFAIDLRAGVSLLFAGESFAGVELSLHLSGPAPWIAHGTATLELPILPDIDFDLGPLRWGEEDHETPPRIDPRELVVKALGEPGACAPRLPEGVQPVAIFHAPAAGDGPVVDPASGFELRQHVVPLDTEITHIGGSQVSTPRVTLGEPLVGGHALRTAEDTRDPFPLGQFRDLTDDQKLHEPAFTECVSGKRLYGSDQARFGAPAEAQYDWKTVYPRHPAPGQPLAGSLDLPGELVAAVVNLSPVARSRGRLGNSYATVRETVELR